jgi:uncharacterized repeat protein (TIGR01451 family)
MKTKIATLTLFLVLATLAIGTVSAAPVTVKTIQIPAGSSNAQIQALIDGGNDGDTINFAPGTYNDINLIINHTLNLVGNGAVINGLNATNKSIFTVTNPGDTDGSGSTFNGFELNLLDNNVTVSPGKLGSTGYAIELKSVSDVVVQNVTSHNGKAAVYNDNAKNILINNCTFTDNYGYCYGFHIMNGNNLTVNNSTITGCADGVSMASAATNITIENSNLLNNINAAFWGGGVSNITIKNNMINGFYEGLGIEKAASQTYVINNTFINGWGNNSAQKASGDAIYIKNSYAHGPLSVIDDIQIIGNTFKNIIGAAVGVDNQAGQGLFIGNGTGNSIVGVNNTVNNVSKGYVVLYSQGQALNFTLDSSTPQVQPPKPVYGNLTIKGTIGSAAMKTGDKTTYTITVRNIGTSNATNVLVSNILKSSFFSSATTYASLGNYANGIWNIGSLNSGNTASLVVTATAIKSGVTSSQAIATANGNLKATSNVIQKTIQKNVVIGSSNRISASKAKIGSMVSLTTTITNTGKDISNPVTLKMTLPRGAKIVSVNQKATYNNKNHSWTFKIQKGAKMQFTTKVKVTSKGTKTVKFTLNGKTQSKSFKAY